MTSDPIDSPRTSPVGAFHQELRTPDQVALELPIAGPSTRMLAYGIDYLLIFVLQVGLIAMIVLTLPPVVAWLGGLFEQLQQDLASGDVDAFQSSTAVMFFFVFLLLTQLVNEILYFIFWETVSGGRSPGKMALKLRVVREGGQRINFGASALRNLMRIADILPSSYLVGVISMVASDAGRRLGDLAAGTLVVREDRPPRAARSESETISPSASYRFDRAQIQSLGTTELQLIRRTLGRLEGLDSAQREPVLARTVEVLRQKIGYGGVEPREREDFLRALLSQMESF